MFVINTQMTIFFYFTNESNVVTWEYYIVKEIKRPTCFSNATVG